MARGLKKSWKQPIFYDFDCKMSSELLKTIIAELSNAGFSVVAIVCDMGPTNRKLWKDLGVTPEKPWFQHPCHSVDKVFTFADVPHLLKLIRHHFLDTGLVYKNEILADLLSHTNNCDTSITYKSSDEHLSVKDAGRQEVKLAVQLFSNATANAIRRCFSLGMEIYKATETSEFIQLVNDWFDVFNSSFNSFGLPGKEPYGNALDNQQTTLTRMSEAMSVPAVPNRKKLEIFQKGILISNAALRLLHQYILEKYRLSYVLTRRLNQDVLEHFFGSIRSKGGLNDHPSPQEFKYRLRKYILARNTEQLNGTGNVEVNSTECLSNECAIGNGQSETVTHSEDNATVQDIQMTSDQSDAEIQGLCDTDSDDIGILQEDALEQAFPFGGARRKLIITNL